MFSRAHLLIERDLEKLQKKNPWGIEASPLKENNIFEISAKILGPVGTIWEGGVFRLYLKFNETYNYSPPEACFHTIPFHPNVDMITGKPWVDSLCIPREWNNTCTIESVLREIQELLVEPDLDNVVNIEATEMLMYSPHGYNQVVQECVAASQRVEAGLDPHPENEKVRFAPLKPEPPRAPSAPHVDKTIAKVSFEDYHLTWRNIATSKTAESDTNLIIESIANNPAMHKLHFGLPMEEMRMQDEQQLQEHKNIVYGTCRPTKISPDNGKQNKIEKVNQMRKIYLQHRSNTKLAKEDTERSPKADEEPWETEVDDLVKWTDKLDDSSI